MNFFSSISYSKGMFLRHLLTIPCRTTVTGCAHVNVGNTMTIVQMVNLQGVKPLGDSDYPHLTVPEYPRTLEV